MLLLIYSSGHLTKQTKHVTTKCQDIGPEQTEKLLRHHIADTVGSTQYTIELH